MADDNQLAHLLKTIKLRSENISFYYLMVIVATLKEHFSSQFHFDINFDLKPYMHFIPREILGFEYQIADERVDITVEIGFFGLQGTYSPLPAHYSEQIIFDETDDDALNAFYNFFNQRLLRLLYESNLKNDYVNRFRRSFTDDVTKKIMAFGGQWTRYSNNAVPDFYKQIARFIPYLSRKQLSKSDVECIIKYFFNFKSVAIENFTERMVPVDSASQATLNSHANELGKTFIIGRYKIDLMNNCLIHIYVSDPVQFLPGSDSHAVLDALCCYLLPRHLIYKIILYTDQIVRPELGAASVYLGWTFLLGKDVKKQVIKL